MSKSVGISFHGPPVMYCTSKLPVLRVLPSINNHINQICKLRGTNVQVKTIKCQYIANTSSHNYAEAKIPQSRAIR